MNNRLPNIFFVVDLHMRRERRRERVRVCESARGRGGEREEEREREGKVDLLLHAKSTLQIALRSLSPPPLPLSLPHI